MTPRYFMFIAYILVPIAASASDCEAIIEMSKVLTIEVFDKAIVEEHVAGFCSEYQHTKDEEAKSRIGARYGFVAAEMKHRKISVDEVASLFCAVAGSERASRYAYERYVDRIAPGAYDAYARCVEMSDHGLFFGVQEASILPDSISLSVSYVSKVRDDEAASIAVMVSSGVTCVWNGGSMLEERNIASGETAILQCNRDSREVESYVRVTRTDGTGEELVLPWRAYDEYGILLESRARVYAGEIDIAEDAVRTQRRQNRTFGKSMIVYVGQVVFPSAFRRAPIVTLQLTTLVEKGTNKGFRHAEFSLQLFEVQESHFIYRLVGPDKAMLEVATANWIAVESSR